MAETNSKNLDPQAVAQSVVSNPSVQEHEQPHAHPFIIHVAQAANTITPWGVNFRRRDKELRSFWNTEPWLASVVYSVSVRNASFKWQVTGADPSKPKPRNTTMAVDRMLHQSNRGKGWKDLLLKTCVDLYTQSNGAWWELIRSGNRPDSPVINIAHLDAGRMTRTGDPEFPAIYTDRRGKERVMRWWEVRDLSELPSPIEEAFGMQYCAVDRCLLAAEIVQSISVYKQEKVGGTFSRAIDVVSGITQRNIDDALALAEEQALNRGLYRYSLPIVVPGVDPSSTLSHIHIDLASLPDNFDEDTSFKWYVAQLAAAFGVDYQEIAPLMTGNLGSSQQSEIMHLKTRGKGPALIMGMIEDILNGGGILPSNVRFEFLEQDLRSETEKAEARFTRSKDRNMRLKSGELDAKAARWIAVQDGDMPEWLAQEIDARQEREERTEQQAEDEQNRNEMGGDQIEGGMETQFRASVGNPSATIIGLLAEGEDQWDRLRSDLVTRYRNQPLRVTPNRGIHLTLVHTGIVDETEAMVIKNNMRSVSETRLPIRFTVSRVGYFDTPNGKAIVALVDDNAVLKEYQSVLYEEFSRLGVRTSEFSNPEMWTPHVTLGYVDSEVVLEPFDITPFSSVLWAAEFTRTDYITEESFYA